jgi:predicted acetyltransferase/catechol 2,3-dioxygenase-like lactoylglutathione lyase family enzyme
MTVVVRLHHAQITIPKGAEDEARRFYCELLGLEEIEKPDSLKGRGGFWLGVGDIQVHVGTEDGVDRALTKAHLAYQVDEINAWRERVVAAGVNIGDSVAIPGYERFEIRDPFGNRVEFIQPVLFLSPPSTRYKHSFIEYVREFHLEGRYYEVTLQELRDDFDVYVRHLLVQADPEQIGDYRVPETYLWLILGDEVVGVTRIRHRLTSSLRRYGGNIGYEIRPSRRRQGYGREILRLALGEARKLGLDRALVTCNTKNVASRHIIEHNNGVFEGEDDVFFNGVTIRERRYWIEIKPHE